MYKSIFYLLLILIFFSCNSTQKDDKDVFVFYYFEGYSGEKGGLFAAFSYDLHSWQKLGDSLVRPMIGEWNVFRDPSVMRSEDGTYHLLWTTGSSGFGYANSTDGVNWSNEKFVVVEDTARGFEFANVWAPEFFTEGDSTYIIWSSTLMKDYVPPKDPAKWWSATHNHRFYYTATTDFVNFTPTRKFWDPGFNAIDATVYKRNQDQYYIFFKDERSSSKKILMAQSKNFSGPYTDTVPLTYRYTEGAIALETDTVFVLYYDYHHEYNGYRYMTTQDMENWTGEIMPEKVNFEDVIRHGSIVRITPSELENMKEAIQ